MKTDRRSALAGMGMAAAASALPWRAAAAAASAPAPRRLSNPAASPAARRLYRYLWSIYGRQTLTGQQERPVAPRDELAWIEEKTGKLPALLGLDYIIPSENAGVNGRALAWHRAGGMVS